MVQKIFKFIKVCIATTGLVVAGLVVYLLFDAATLTSLRPNHQATLQQKDAIVVVGKDGTEVIHDQKMRDLMDKMDALTKNARESAPNQEDRVVRFHRIWSDIKSRMVDPQPGTYPVKFFDPKDGVPLYQGTDQYSQNAPSWIDNNHIMYWAGILKDELYPKRAYFDRYELVVLNVETGKIVKTLAKAEEAGVTCFDPKTGNYFYTVPDGVKGSEIESERVRKALHFGKVSKDLSFEETLRAYTGTGVYWNDNTCAPYNDEMESVSLIRPEDGKIFYKGGGCERYETR